MKRPVLRQVDGRSGCGCDQNRAPWRPGHPPGAVERYPTRERSLSFWHYNTSKRGITLNLETSGGKRLFHRPFSQTDIILETYPPGYLPFWTGV